MKHLMIVLSTLTIILMSCSSKKVGKLHPYFTHGKLPIVTGIDIYENHDNDIETEYIILRDYSFELYVYNKYSIIGTYQIKNNILSLQPVGVYKFDKTSKTFIKNQKNMVDSIYNMHVFQYNIKKNTIIEKCKKGKKYKRTMSKNNQILL